MSQVVLSEAARIDRREITAWTVERFGVGRAHRLHAARNLAEELDRDAGEVD